MPGEASMQQCIKQIDNAVANKICSGQVITCLANAVKELIENSLDAGATSLEVRLIDSGLASIEVCDNGHGIDEKNYEALCWKNSTSKLNNVDDLITVRSFGFRGEALNALCSLCAGVTVVTKTESSAVATVLDFNKEGKLIKTSIRAANKGTTVTLKELFDTYPVRRQEMVKKIKKNLNEVLDTLNSYALAIPELRLVCWDTPKTGPKKQLLNVLSEKSLAAKLHLVLKQNAARVEFVQSDVLEEVADEFKIKVHLCEDFLKHLKISGFVSRTGSGHSSGDKQYFSVNRRPVVLPKLSKVINQVFRSFDNASMTFPFFVLDISVPFDKVDINVTPDKRSVMILNEPLILAVVKSSLLKMYGQDACNSSRFEKRSTQIAVTQDAIPVCRGDEVSIIERGTKRSVEEDSVVPTKRITDYYNTSDKLIVESPTIAGHIPVTPQLSPQVPNDPPRPSGSPITFMDSADLPHFVPASTLINVREGSNESRNGDTVNMSSATAVALPAFPRTLTPSSTFASENTSNFMRRSTPSPTTPTTSRQSRFEKYRAPGSQPPRRRSSSESESVLSLTRSSVVVNNRTPANNMNQSSRTMSSNTSMNITQTPCTQEEEAAPPIIRRRTEWSLTMDTIMKSLNEVSIRNRNPSGGNFTAKLDPSDDKKAEDELQRTFSKESFKKLKINGQFNKGFVLAQLDADVFVVDQHASDERYNFDDLLSNPQLEKQVLVQPRALHLTAHKESEVLDHKEVFLRNGFTIDYDEEKEPGKRIELTTVPVYSRDTFGTEAEFDEILSIIEDSVSVPRNCWPRKLKDILASKACRKSVMIKDDLDKPKMRELLDHMSVTSYPWTCAHGRPTMRHLMNIEEFLLNN